jgi:predicted ArsR family transcriptional regulator
MTSTRETILKTILKRQRVTINDLAEVVGINPISIRHHIIKLEANGMVSSEDERHGVGRPRRVYFLTDEGMEEFPTRYLALTTRLLEKVKATLPEDTVDELFVELGREMAEEAAGDVAVNLPMEERLLVLQEYLQNEGFNVDWERREDGYYIKELSCPYYQVGQKHPEVCSVDRTMISKFLSVPATRVNCILDGDSYCTYVVPLIQPSEIQISDS